MTSQILNQIHKARLELPAQPFVGVHEVVEDAKRQVNAANPVSPGFYYRPNLIKAAALLVQAIEKLDRADEDKR